VARKAAPGLAGRRRAGLTLQLGAIAAFVAAAAMVFAADGLPASWTPIVALLLLAAACWIAFARLLFQLVRLRRLEPLARREVLRRCIWGGPPAALGVLWDLTAEPPAPGH
jgi:hypothetical protein